MEMRSTLVSTRGAAFRAVVLATALGIPAAAFAQANAKMTPIATPDQPNAIELGTGPLPDAKAQESWHSQYGSKFARNVTVATITPFLPDPVKASGAAVVVAPGGGFRTLSMENEGWNVARALAERGVAAFVLKYRLNQTPADMAGFERSMAEMFSGTAARPPRPDPQQMMARLEPQIADSRAAFALIRRRAAEWKIDPDRIGMVGFSAGAMLTMATALVGQDAKPAFLGNIYGPLAAVTVPADAPPLFVALAADDPLFGNAGFGLIDSWRAAKKPVEFHLYEQGGHGFGMYPKETTSTGWFDAFTSWLTMHGMRKPRVAANAGAAGAGKYTYVVVHGATAGGWEWKKTGQFLSDDGHTVHRVTLTGLGERMHLNSPEIDLETHIKDVVNLILFEDLHDVVLTGHSYGGMVITGVMDRVPERIRHVVFLDAAVPEDGMSLWDLFGGRGPQDPSRFADGFMQVPWVKADAVPPHNVKQSIKCFSQPVSYKNPAAQKLPVTYVAFIPKDKTAEERAKTDKSWQRAVARGWTIRTFPGGHVAQQEDPRGVATLMEEAVADENHPAAAAKK